MSEIRSDRSGETDTLLERVRLIENQPLDERAEAFAEVHNALQSTLEGGDATASHG